MTLLYIQIKKDTVLCQTVVTVRLTLKKIPSVQSKRALKFSQETSINIATMCVKFLLHFGNFPGSNLDQDNGWDKAYCAFPQPLPTNGTKLYTIKLIHNLFLPNLSQSFIPATDGVVK
jgi:hypothetical protein